MQSTKAVSLSTRHFRDWLLASAARQPGSKERIAFVVADDDNSFSLHRHTTDQSVIVAIDDTGRLPRGWSEVTDVQLSVAADAPAPWVRVIPADLDRILALFGTRVSACPIATAVLAQVLRIGDRLDFEAALVLESLAYSALQNGPEFKAWRQVTPIKPANDTGEERLKVERHGGTLGIELRRPAAHNALCSRMRTELAEALKIAVLDASIERVELSGEGPSFCSGGDLNEFGTAPDSATAHVVRMAQSACSLLDPIRARVRAHVQGACIGAGAEIAACAGYVEATRNAYFRLPELGMGLIPGAGGTASIPRRIGRHRTLYLALSGEDLDSETALAWGLIDELLGDD